MRIRDYLAVLAVLAVITAAMVALRSFIGLATVGLIYLLTVFIAAIRWGRGPSLTAALVAFLAQNFFFTVPYHTFVVASSEDVISLIAFLFVAAMTSRLVGRLKDQMAQRLRLQQEAAQAEVLRRTDELKSQLLSAVSHDLRTPLTTIRMAATALQHDGAEWSDDARGEMLEMIDAEAARLSRLVGNLLDLSRIEAGVLRPAKELCNLQEVATKATDTLRDRLRDHQVRMAFPPDLSLVPLDFTQIEDVFVNLLDNSVRHAPEGSTITVTARAQGDQVVVQIDNQGPAVPVEAAGQIFDRFYAAQGQRRGTGLGLAICKGLVEAHGGRIWVERPGEPGARFAFSLPLDASSTAVGEHPPANLESL